MVLSHGISGASCLIATTCWSPPSEGKPIDLRRSLQERFRVRSRGSRRVHGSADDYESAKRGERFAGDFEVEAAPTQNREHERSMGDTMVTVQRSLTHRRTRKERS